MKHSHIRSGDLVQLIDDKDHTFIISAKPGETLHTHRGILPHDELIGSPWGSRIETHTGYAFLTIMPSLGDLLMRINRSSQIMYPKDIGYLVVNMGIGPGKTVIDAGTGSGALAVAFAYLVGSEGKVISYEIREDMQETARENLEKLGLIERVDLKIRDIALGFDETGVDALFLDVPNPEDYLLQVRQALSAGKPFGCLVPTTNQVSRLLAALQEHQFGFIEVCEIFLRFYKPIVERLRPTDRMVGHTGYLIFARPVLDSLEIQQYEVTKDTLEE